MSLSPPPFFSAAEKMRSIDQEPLSSDVSNLLLRLRFQLLGLSPPN